MASNFGVVGDGITDDSRALQSVLNTAAKLGATVVLARSARIKIANTVSVPSHTHLNGNGATLTNATRGGSGRILRLIRVRDVTVEYINFDGEKSSHGPVTEQRHNVVLSGAHNVTFDRIHSYNAKGDGLYVGDQINGTCVNVKISNSMFDQNHRQGMSITNASGLIATNCHFGSTVGTAPQAGVDIEPNSDDSVIEDLEFRECSFMNNVGGGLLISLRPTPTAIQSGGIYTSCQFSENIDSVGILLSYSRDVKIIGGSIRGNGRDGVMMIEAQQTSLHGVSISRNHDAGVNAVSTLAGLTVNGCIFDSNGMASRSNSFGVISAPAAGHHAVGLAIENSTFQNMYGGIKTSAATSEVTLEDNVYKALTENTVLDDELSSRHVVDANTAPTP